LNDGELDFTEEHELEEEDPHTLVSMGLVWERRQLEMSTPSVFCSNFALFITEDNPSTVRETMDSEEGKLCKKSMIEEIAALGSSEVVDWKKSH
jgi:hypothetical protein